MIQSDVFALCTGRYRLVTRNSVLLSDRFDKAFFKICQIFLNKLLRIGPFQSFLLPLHPTSVIIIPLFYYCYHFLLTHFLHFSYDNRSFCERKLCVDHLCGLSPVTLQDVSSVFFLIYSALPNLSPPG